MCFAWDDNTRQCVISELHGPLGSLAVRAALGGFRNRVVVESIDINHRVPRRDSCEFLLIAGRLGSDGGWNLMHSPAPNLHPSAGPTT